MLIEHARQFFLEHHPECQHIDVGLSGGLDSSVLLHIAVALRRYFTFSLRAVHIHHGLQPEAENWLSFCENYCNTLQVPFYFQRVNIPPQSKRSLEALARDARYAVFAAELPKRNAVLWTAHHAHDQLETVLFQWIRGSGLSGLAGMPECKVFFQGKHARPLLTSDRSELIRYAEEHKLTWVEDASNQSLQFSRNFLRQRILPEITTRFPGVVTTMQRTITHLAEARMLLDEYALQDLKNLVDEYHCLSVKQLVQHSPAKQALLMRTWITQAGMLTPDTQKLHAMLQQVHAAPDRHPIIFFGDAVWARSYERLFLLSNALWQQFQAMPTALAKIWSWEANPIFHFDNGFTLRTRAVSGRGFAEACHQVTVMPAGKCVSVTIRKRGVRSISKLCQTWRVPIWQRAHLPLLFVDDYLACVPGYFMDPHFAVAPHAIGHEVQWQCA